MKKLALVLGSLLVVGTAASAKEVMPAPVMVPERIVEIVEKPVIIYREKEVVPAWRPSGSVSVEAKITEGIEGHKTKDDDDFGWKGADLKTKLTTKADIMFTEKQKLDVKFEDTFGLEKEALETAEDGNSSSTSDKHLKTELKHTYMFGKLGSSMVDLNLESTFTHESGSKVLKFKPVFDFSEYFFKNDYIKATALQLAPVFAHEWTSSDKNANVYALYANAEFELPYGVTFQAEFDNLFNYKSENKNEKTTVKNYDRTAKTGAVELTLAKNFGLYNEGKHKVDFRLEGVYGTKWSYSRNDKASVDAAGTRREGTAKTERWGTYTAKFEPSLGYTFKATEYVSLTAKLGGEYVNRADSRHSAKHWRWQPYAKVGFKATF